MLKRSIGLVWLLTLILPLVIALARATPAIEATSSITEVRLGARANVQSNGQVQAQATSATWAGYVVKSDYYNPQPVVTSVSGSWVVQSAAPSNNPTYSCQWVGIGGVKDEYQNDLSLIQAGTESNYANGKPDYYAWYELVAPGNSQFRISILGLNPVSPGDAISCVVSSTGTANQWDITIEDTTQNWAWQAPTPFTYTSSQLTAEWIDERPSKLVGGTPQPQTLADFGTAYFTECSANNSPIGSWAAYASNTMTESGHPDSDMLAYPSALSANGGGFAVTYATLEGYWKFDEVGSIAHDSSGNGNDGTVNGASYTNGVFNGARWFDGVDDYVHIPNSPSLDISGSQISVEYWVNFPRGWYPGIPITRDWTHGHIVFDKGDAYTAAFMDDTGTQRFNIPYVFPYPETKKNTWDANVWYHIADVFDGSQIRMYVNGVVDNAETVIGNVSRSSIDLAIGSHCYGDIRFFEGILDEFKIYNYARTTEEIRSDYAAGASRILIVRGLNNRIYFGDWTVLPGSTIDSPAAAMLGNQLHIVVRGSDGSTLWYGTLANTSDPTSFSGWALLDGATPSAPTLTSNGTVLCLVVRGMDDRIYYRCYNGSWGQWYAVPTGATLDGPSAAMLGNDLHIVVRGMDGSSLWDVIVSDGTVVRGWNLLSGAAPSKPVLACSGQDSLCLVVEGMDNAIYYRSYTDSTDSWGDWNAIPTGATLDGAGATVIGGMLCTVVRGMDGNTIWYGYTDLTTGNFLGWTLLDGATPSPPTLTS